VNVPRYASYTVEGGEAVAEEVVATTDGNGANTSTDETIISFGTEYVIKRQS